MTIDERVTVGMVNDIPKYMIWKGRSHNIVKVGLRHHFIEGKILYHIFSVTTPNLFMRLKLNTSNLIWTLEQIEDQLT
ncbi:MAG TPA: hypothetical protein VFI61_00780 [Patescibacteria group bacterium]|nr:hypothetical protein [Patescibacteria group bacterium]